MNYRLPIPQNWQDFENICHKLWQDIWNDFNAQKNGRQGQTQNGVDIIGKPAYSNGYAGVQCKDKNGHLGSTLSEKELVRECSNAIEIRPQLINFTLATTAPRDANIQFVARKLTLDTHIPFDVSVWSWDDIETELCFRPLILEHYYPKFEIHSIADLGIKLNHNTAKDVLLAFYSRPQIRSVVSQELLNDIISVSYEICDNAFKHGRATQIHIDYNNGIFSIIDNGILFNPLTQLDYTKANPEKLFRFSNIKSSY